MKIVKSLEESDLLIKDVSETKMKKKELSFASWYAFIILAGKRVIRANEGVIRAGERLDFKCCLIL